MISKADKNADRLARHARVRKKVTGTAERPRFNVYRSLNHIYVQVIDDVKGVTLVSASTMEKAVKEKIANLTKTEAAKVVGAEAAKKARKSKISEPDPGADPRQKIIKFQSPSPVQKQRKIKEITNGR